jgi:hypothetical protein
LRLFLTLNLQCIVCGESLWVPVANKYDYVILYAIICIISYWYVMTCSSPCCSIVIIHHHHWHLRLAPHHLHPVLQYRSHDNGSNPLGESLQHPAASANLAPTATELTRMSYNKPPAHRRSQWCEPRGVKGVVPSLIPNTYCVILYTEVMYIICYSVQ